MAKNNIIAKTGNFIQANKTPLLYIGGAVFVLAVAIPLLRRFTTVLGDKQSKARNPEDVVGGLEPNLDKTTITQNQASAMANQLVEAMSSFPDTDSDDIESVFDRIQNADDMKLLYKTFGVRPYSIVNRGEASNVLFGVIEKLGGFKELDLIGWLNTELGVLEGGTRRLVNEKLELIGFKLSD